MASASSAVACSWVGVPFSAVYGWKVAAADGWSFGGGAAAAVCGTAAAAAIATAVMASASAREAERGADTAA
jgi:hypothetical protein